LDRAFKKTIKKNPTTLPPKKKPKESKELRDRDTDSLMRKPKAVRASKAERRYSCLAIGRQADI